MERKYKSRELEERKSRIRKRIEKNIYFKNSSGGGPEFETTISKMG
jgi:hypothetical protein